MLIIVEGIDLTGKTTLVRELEKQLASRTTVIHAGPCKRHPIEEYEHPAQGYRPLEFEHLLLDRWHLGESVWPRVFERETQLDGPVRRHIEMFLQSRGAVLVLAEARETALRDRLSTRKEPITPEQVGDILYRFKTAAKYSILPRVPYDFEREDVGDFAFHVMCTASGYEALASKPFDVTDEWIGHPTPRILYVGERIGPERPEGKAPGSQLPFVPYRNTSGWHLLHSMPIGPTSAIVNAYDSHGLPTVLDQLWMKMQQPNVVALGNVAHEALKRAELKHGIAPHPQYVRRFHARALPAGYRDMLKRAVYGEDTRGELKNWKSEH